MGDDDEILANGVMADTGRPLPGAPLLIPQPVAASVHNERDAADKRLAQIAAGKMRSYSVDPDYDPNALTGVGWGLIFPAAGDSTAIEQALAPLIALRKTQVKDETRCKIFKGQDGYQAGETAVQWLGRHNVGLDVVNPRQGVPYYLMLVGSPDEIPMTFQYTLDLYWAVGRLFLRSAEEYSRYAQSVVDYEKPETIPATLRKIGLFATEHDFDGATQMFSKLVAKPMRDGDGFHDPIGKAQNFAREARMGEQATKLALAKLLSDPAGSPALLFSGSHGMAFSPDDPRLADCQGALVCQDWSSYGAVAETDWFAASDLPAYARLRGMIHFMFACYGGGWGKIDTFRDGPDGTALQIAPAAAFSRLPQAMLAHPNGGALATIGHVDRAWSYSFKSDSGATQITGLRSVLTNLMLGHRIGQATDAFNMRWAAIATSLSDDLRAGGGDAAQLAREWIARDDARNYIILGDPAVRLRVEQMPMLPP